MSKLFKVSPYMMSYHNDTTFQKSIIFVFANVAYEQNM